MNKQAVLGEKMKSPEHRLKLERWQGLPHINKAKQYETLLSFKFSLFIQFVCSVTKTQRV